jgi:quercetin dioxygenase-like cupin family protein
VERGGTSWKTLISAGRTASNALTLGVARLPPGGALRAHRHAQAEVDFVRGGSGEVTVDGVRHVVGAGDAVFLPGDAVHSVAARNRRTSTSPTPSPPTRSTTSNTSSSAEAAQAARRTARGYLHRLRRAGRRLS